MKYFDTGSTFEIYKYGLHLVKSCKKVFQLWNETYIFKTWYYSKRLGYRSYCDLMMNYLIHISLIIADWTNIIHLSAILILFVITHVNTSVIQKCICIKAISFTYCSTTHINYYFVLSYLFKQISNYLLYFKSSNHINVRPMKNSK